MVRATQLAGLAGMATLMLAGCDVARSARSDFDRLVSDGQATSSRPARVPTRSAARPAAAPAANPQPASKGQPAPEKPVVTPPPVNLIGQTESAILARFGPPTSQEDRSPGKTWRYRHEQCALDVSLYPDVQTRQFTTLAYEVRSDDNTDQGKQLCLGQLQSRRGSR